MIGGFCEFGFGIVLEQEGGIPAAHEHQAMGIKNGAQLGGHARKLVAKFHALKARGLGFAQALLQRNPAADFLHVIIGPADGVGADPYCHRCVAFS